ncbi:MAG: hypothetical protein ACRYGA_07130 [Janthinobacterium lividum]
MTRFKMKGLGTALLLALAAFGEQGFDNNGALRAGSMNSAAHFEVDRSKDIAGPDANANGVRDDIESWINAQPIDERQRKSLMQEARVTQRTLVVNLKDEAALQKTGEGFAASAKCGGDSFPIYSMFSRLADKIEALTANTKERAARYMQYNAARSGSSTTHPSGDACEP